MSVRSRYYPNLYKDSVSLMTVSAKVTSVAGVSAASVVMASATNVDNMKQAGLGDFEVRPNDLVVAVAGSDAACDEALKVADELLTAKSSGAEGGEGAARQALTSIQMAVARDPSHNLALISVPGDYAAAEAIKALRLGMDVMLFSDNVDASTRSLALKTYARDHDPDGQGPRLRHGEIINGMPLGFANEVRRGPVGVVGASGTGTQEVTVGIHQHGSGVSQALGTGGHDLACRRSAASRCCRGLRRWRPTSGHARHRARVPSRRRAEVAAKVLAAASASVPVVVIFLGVDPASTTRKGVFGAATPAHAAAMGAALADAARAAQRAPITLSEGDAAKARPRWRERWRQRAALRSRRLFWRNLQLPGAAHPRGRRLQGLLQHAHCRQFRAPRATAAAAATRSSTWATTSTRRDVRIR